MQIGQTIWAIDPCEIPSGKKYLTVGKAYEIKEVTLTDVRVFVDTNENLFFFKDKFDKFFSLTPPKEKEGVNIKMELNYLKVLLPVVKEDLQISYDIIGHESTAINRFVSKVEELINSQS